MTLDEQIAQITNPQEFARLCNAVFTEIHGLDYQVIDGTRGDNGNDGYLSGEARMLAIYCPIKPEQRTDAQFLAKIRSDLAKAAKLKADGKYAIERWTFITPRKLADDVVSTMHAEAAQVGIVASHAESAYLANELQKQPHVLKNFPALQQFDIFAMLEELRQIVTDKSQHAHSPAAARAPAPAPVVDDLGQARVRSIMEAVPSAAVKTELRVIAYSTNDPIVEINALLTLLRWFEPADDDYAELTAFADRAALLAKKHHKPDIAAVCHAHKAQVLVTAFNLQFIETYFALQVDIKIGFAVTAAAEKNEQQARLRQMDHDWRAEAQAALELLQQSTDLVAIGSALQVLGSTNGTLALLHRVIGENTAADRHLGECKALLMAAKDMHNRAGDELGAINAVFNLANQIRFHGKGAEALELAKSIAPVAQKYGDQVLLLKAQWLLEAIATGKVPAYELGERRSWAPQGVSK
jgi:hypothetical protein